MRNTHLLTISYSNTQYLVLQLLNSIFTVLSAIWFLCNSDCLHCTRYAAAFHYIYVCQLSLPPDPVTLQIVYQLAVADGKAEHCQRNIHNTPSSGPLHHMLQYGTVNKRFCYCLSNTTPGTDHKRQFNGHIRGIAALTLLAVYFLLINTCATTVRKLIFDRFSFGDFDRSPVVNMNSGAVKGTKYSRSGPRGVGSPQVYAVVHSGNIVCVCAHVCLTRLYSTFP